MDDIFVSFGCLDDYCLGSTVISGWEWESLTYGSGWTGTIIGINESNKQIAVHWKTNSKSYKIKKYLVHSVSTILISSGCLDRFCVKDRVIGTDGSIGEVVGC